MLSRSGKAKARRRFESFSFLYCKARKVGRAVYAGSLENYQGFIAPREFESHIFLELVAQLAEPPTFNRAVVGSTPIGFTWHITCNLSILMPPPSDLVRYGYANLEHIERLRTYKIRAWYDKKFPINGRYEVWVSPWLVDILRSYWKLSVGGRRYAGMTEWEFILSAIPESDQS